MLLSPALGFKTSMFDTSLFIKVDGSDVILLLLYVDDIILNGSNCEKIQSVIDSLADVFDLKDMDGSLFVNQSKYTKELLKKAGMKHCKLTTTLSKPHSQLLTTEGTPLSDPTHYRSLVGALQYLTFTGLNIAHSVNVMCQYMTNPSDSHLHLVKRVMQYLKGTLDYGLQYTPSSNFQLNAYSDSDWATDINTRRSITGYVVYLGSNSISWQSKKQSTVSQSSTKAKYKALAHCAANVFWIRSVLRDVHQVLTQPPTLHYIVTDVFTKGIHSPVFIQHCNNLHLGVSDDEQEHSPNTSVSITESNNSTTSTSHC
ncbi:hypothetical protein EV2_029093 [Malus domestica]